jgi:predicted membrane-bound mannosyltransferase
MTHYSIAPFLYVMGALGYFLFGDNDTTARITPALFSIALGLTPYLLRREIGRTGAIIASIIMLASPVFCISGAFSGTTFMPSYLKY